MQRKAIIFAFLATLFPFYLSLSLQRLPCRLIRNRYCEAGGYLRCVCECWEFPGQRQIEEEEKKARAGTHTYTAEQRHTYGFELFRRASLFCARYWGMCSWDFYANNDMGLDNEKLHHRAYTSHLYTDGLRGQWNCVI